MHLSEIVGVIADESGASRGRIEMISRRLYESGVIPKGAGGSNRPSGTIEHALLILLGHLSGLEYINVPRFVMQSESYRCGKAPLLPAITDVLKAAIGENGKRSVMYSLRHSLTVVLGDRPAIVLRHEVNGAVVDHVFTPGGERWVPEAAEEISDARTLPGYLLGRLALALRPLLPEQIVIPDAVLRAQGGF